MTFGAMSPTPKYQCQWVRGGRQMAQDQGGLVPVALKTRSIQVLFGVILIFVTTTLFTAAVTIGETMSQKVHFGLTFSKPLRLRQAIHLRNESEKIVDELGRDAQHRRRLDWESILVKGSNPQLPTQQLLKGSEKARRDDGMSMKSSNKRDIKYTRQMNDLFASDESARGRQHEMLNSSKPAGGGEIGVDNHVRNEDLHQNLAGSLDPELEGSKLIRRVVDRAQERPAGWLQFPDFYSDGDETEQLMVPIRQNGTLPCHDVKTKTAQLLGLPRSSNVDEGGTREERVIRLLAGRVYEIVIVSIGDDDRPRCAGGDYYETDLSGPLWKSRPPVVDLNNGTYAVHLQMDPRFAGRYTFTVVLLFANFHALHFHPRKYSRMEDIATFEIEFSVPDETLMGSNLTNSSTPAADPNGPELPICRPEDFERKYWSGRWTREQFNEDCEYDRDGRWQCVDTQLQCQKPWCEGPVGSLESNGWVYSAHCAFKIFQKEEAWKCLDGKWLFFWGDSNHVDTIRNLLNFVLGFENEIKSLDRRMDTTFSSPPDNRSSVRITSMFNGHSNVSLNYEGLFSLRDNEFAAQLRSYFTGETAPDVMVMNSGLHDGLYWRNMDTFLTDGVEYAVEFWSDVWSMMTARRPHVLYRTTIATGGQSRNMSFNPHKMELFNHLIVDRFFRMKLERFQIIDGFDYTFPWHWDHKTNDGVHYGRPPSRTKWAGNNVGHRYFVDLMLAHMLLNAICMQ